MADPIILTTVGLVCPISTVVVSITLERFWDTVAIVTLEFILAATVRGYDTYERHQLRQWKLNCVI